MDSSAEELFGRLPASTVFDDLDTCIELIWLVNAISGGGSSKETVMRLLRQLSANFDALKTSIRGKVGREELRKRLQDVADGARQIHREMEDHAVLSMLIAEERGERGNCTAHEVEARRRCIEDLARLAKAAAARVPEGKGGKRYDTDGFSAQELCAFIVRRLWHEAHGVWPGAQNPRVWDACERLWKAAGGKCSPRNGEMPSRWRRALKKAETPPAAAPLGAAIFKGGDGHLAIVEHIGRHPESSTKKA